MAAANKMAAIAGKEEHDRQKVNKKKQNLFNFLYSNLHNAWSNRWSFQTPLA
jgi:hypothetical protein